jgi:hypothetical protein
MKGKIGKEKENKIKTENKWDKEIEKEITHGKEKGKGIKNKALK